MTYDPRRADEDVVKWAITEPYYDAALDDWRNSPFSVKGYDPLAVELP